MEKPTWREWATWTLITVFGVSVLLHDVWRYRGYTFFWEILVTGIGLATIIICLIPTVKSYKGREKK